MKQEQPSALDGLIRLYIWPCFHRWTKCFTSRSTNAGRQIRGCVLLSVFSSKPSMQMRCCRVEYGSNGNRHEKSRLLLPSVETLRFKPRARAWVNGFNFVAFHGNDLIISTIFICCQTIQVATVLIAKFVPGGQFSIGQQRAVLFPKCVQAHSVSQPI